MRNKITSLAILAMMFSPLACYADGADAVDTVTSNVRSVGGEVVDVVSDSAITTQVKTVLAAEPGISSLNINVTTIDGVVSLKGRVKSDDQKSRVVKLVKNVNSVKGVDASYLVVRP